MPQKIARARLMMLMHLSARMIPLVLSSLAFSSLAFSGLAFAEPGAAAPQSPAADSDEVAQKASSIARQTMSPFCPGRTLSDCPSEYAAEWRRDIREMVARGMSASEIQAELESRAGNNLSGSPNREVSYAFPIGVTLGAGLVLYLLFARLRIRKGEGEVSADTEDVAESKGESAKKGAKTKEKKTKSAQVTGDDIDDDRLRQELDAESSI